MFAHVAGLWILASIIGAVGVAMQVRWALTRTENPGARTIGILKASIVEAVGLGLLVLSAQAQTIVAGLLISMGLGMFVGFIAARALRPPG